VSATPKMRSLLIVLIVIIIVLAALSGYFAMRLTTAPATTVTVGIGVPGGKKLTNILL
jgi:flagellar basal body-associated protein FliL